MNHDLQVTGTVLINVNPKKVWEVLTTPEIIKEYLFGTETITDWQPGSAIIFQGEYGEHKYRDHGVILENIPMHRLSYSYWTGFSGLPDAPENYSTITYLIEALDNNSTQFSWIQKGYANEAGYNHSIEGMEAFMSQIKGIAER